MLLLIFENEVGVFSFSQIGYPRGWNRIYFIQVLPVGDAGIPTPTHDLRMT